MLEEEMGSILAHYHSFECRGHFGGNKTTAKVLKSGFYWPTLFRDAYAYVSACDRCQRMGTIFKRDKAPLKCILEVELFDV